MRVNSVLNVFISLFLCVFFILSVVIVEASNVPQLINYQGRLTDGTGEPVPDGYYTLTFAIYNSATSGTPVWGPITPKPIWVSGGLFNWQIGYLEDFGEGFFEDTSRWLGITVDTDPEIEPRTQLTSVPYAFHALRADTDNDWTQVDGNSYRVSGNVGIGMADPRAKLDVAGVIRILRDDDMEEPGEGEGLELMYDPINRVGIIQVFDRFAGYRQLNLDHGYVGVGIMNPQYRLDIAGECHASSFPTSSDIRFKSEIKELDNVLEKFDKIRGVYFTWNEKYESLGRSTGHREIGVVAQEIEKVFPELVTTWGDDDYRAVDYGRLSGVLIEAIKELKAENEELKKRLDKLENK